MLMTALCCAGEPTILSVESEADFYVSPKGSDDWSGTLSQPSGEQSDGPFATLEAARDAVRSPGKNQTEDVLILVRGGSYQLNKTVVFGLQDSGQGDAVVTYAAYPGETPVFSSGQEIKNWKPLTATLASLPEKATGKVQVADLSNQSAPNRFRTLFDVEGLLPRARSTGFIPHEGSGRDRLRFPAGRLKNWPNVKDMEIVVRPHHAWIVNMKSISYGIRTSCKAPPFMRRVTATSAFMPMVN